MTRPRTRSSSSQVDILDNINQNSEFTRNVESFKQEFHSSHFQQTLGVNKIISMDEVELDDDREHEGSDISSSPVKKFPLDNFSVSSHYENSDGDSSFSSSPIKKKKTVAFSDDLVLDVPSSPGNSQTPRKSILKPHNINKELYSKSSQRTLNNGYSSKKLSPADPNYWIAGSVLQLVPGSQDLVELSEGCIKVLYLEDFDKRFEVYATLNNIFRSNSKDTLLKLFTITPNSFKSPAKYSPVAKSAPIEPTNISKLAHIIQQDIIKLENELFTDIKENSENISQSTKADPFRIRIISQAMKIINSILVDPDLNNYVSLENIKWFYEHCCIMITKQNISKALVSSYLVLIKDCRLGNKRKKIVFENNGLPEKILQSVILMKWFPSASVITEKFTALRNLIINFPVMMSKNISQWFHILLFNVATNTSPMYMKATNVGVQALLEASRNYLDSKNILDTIRSLLENPIPTKIKSFITDVDLEEIGDSKEMSTIDYLIHTLEILVENSHYRLAMDIWVAITLLSADKDNGFETWRFLPQWLKVHKLCFNIQDNNAKLIALTSWKAIVYNICNEDLGNIRKVVEPISISSNKKVKSPSINTILKPKIKLLMHILLNVTAIENQNEIIEVLNDIFLSIVYTLLNPLSFKSSTKYIHIYWDKIIQPVLISFYFKKDSSTLYMNELGLKFLTRLLKTFSPINERNYNDLRCLANDPVSLAEINSLPSRWVFLKFDKILQNIILVFQSKVNVEQKLIFFSLFLDNIKIFTKKEIKASSTTFDIIDNLPYVLETFFNNTEVTFESVLKILDNLHNTFDPSIMVSDNSNDENSKFNTNIYIIIIQNCFSVLESQKMIQLINIIFSSIDDKKYNVLLSEMIKLEDIIKNPSIMKMIISNFNMRFTELSKSEYLISRNICRIVSDDYEALVKKLLQGIVTISNIETRISSMDMIDVKSWTLPTFFYYLLLIKGAPNNDLHEYAKRMILKKFENDEEFFEITKYLISHGFDSYLFSIREEIVSQAKILEGFHKFDFNQSWKDYLTRVTESENYSQLDALLHLTYRETEIEILNFIKNKWDSLPLLKSEWLKYNTKLYYDEELLKQQLENTTDFQENDLTNNNGDFITNELNLESVEIPKQDNSNIIHDEKENFSDIPQTSINSIDIEEQNKQVPSSEESIKMHNKAVETSTKNKTKVTTPKGRGRKRTRKSKDNHENSDNINDLSVKDEQNERKNSLASFDIHSFTALVTQKLSTPSPPKKTARKKRSNKTSLDMQQMPSTENKNEISNNSDPIPETPTKSNIALALNKVINEETSIDNQLYNSKESNSISKYNYSEIMQNGFKNEESRISCEESPTSSKRPSPELDLEIPKKKQKVIADYNINLNSHDENSISSPIKEIFMSDTTFSNETITNSDKDQGSNKSSVVYTPSIQVDLFKRQNDGSSGFEYELDKSKDYNTHELVCSSGNDTSREPLCDSNTKSREAIVDSVIKTTIPDLPPTSIGAINNINNNSDSKLNIETRDVESRAVIQISSEEALPKKIDESLPRELCTTNHFNTMEVNNKTSSPIDMLTFQLNEISDEHIASMTNEERYNLETSMMKFMLRMRNT